VGDAARTRLKAGYTAKTDRLDARGLADALRRDSVVSVWYAPPALRELSLSHQLGAHGDGAAPAPSFPSAFIGHDDMSCGALLLRTAAESKELPYVAFSSGRRAPWSQPAPAHRAAAAQADRAGAMAARVRHAQAAISVIFAAPTGRSTLSGRPAGIGDSAKRVELAPTEIADKFGRTQPQCAVKLVP
jgi:hypothetical protein